MTAVVYRMDEDDRAPLAQGTDRSVPDRRPKCVTIDPDARTKFDDLVPEARHRPNLPCVSISESESEGCATMHEVELIDSSDMDDAESAAEVSRRQRLRRPLVLQTHYRSDSRTRATSRRW